jgi:hypothetical protein
MVNQSQQMRPPTIFRSFWATFNSFVNARYRDISVDCSDFEAGFLISYRKIKCYTAKINNIWSTNEIDNNKNHKASQFKSLYTQYIS